MKIEATAKEIADLVLALRGQRSREVSVLIGEKEVGRTTISDCCETMVNSFRSAVYGSVATLLKPNDGQ